MPLEDTRADGTGRRGTPGWVARPQDGPPPVPRPPQADAHTGSHLDLRTDVRTDARTDVRRDVSGAGPGEPQQGDPGLTPEAGRSRALHAAGERDQWAETPGTASALPPGQVGEPTQVSEREQAFEPAQALQPTQRSEPEHVLRPTQAVPPAQTIPGDASVPRAASSSGETGSPARRRSRAAWVLASLLVVVLVVAGALGTYLWRTTDAWQASSAEWEELARASASQLATTQEELATAQDELTETKVQLATAQDRITELADEKAQLGDDSAAQQQLADYQARVSQAAGQVATALATCIDGQQQLIGYMEAADQYDPAELERFREDVDTLCAAATDANTQLQTELEQ